MSDNGWCVWITGLPGSGKSTIAHILLEKLDSLGFHAQILSSDSLRKVMTPNPKYTEDERDIVYETLVYIAKLLTDNGVNVIIDATGNKRKYRDQARSKIQRFIEAYVKCPIKVCIKRESRRSADSYGAPKNIYRKAFTGESRTVPGLGAPYEEPLKPEVTVDSNRLNPEECAEKILKTIVKKFMSQI